MARDTLKQREFHEMLNEESQRLYGSIQCYASHKKFNRNMVASHIKDYKICELENNLEAAYDVNNGLLLRKELDDLFDKWIISFDSDGRIMIAENDPGITDDLRAEIQNCYLDPCIFNDARKRYMEVHRAIFVYKNYLKKAAGKYQTPDQKRQEYSLPNNRSNEIKVFNNDIIYLDKASFVWLVCPQSKLKNIFYSEGLPAPSNFHISNDILRNKLLASDDYQLTRIPPTINLPTKSINIDNPGESHRESNFKLNSCFYDEEEGTPTSFLRLMMNVFKNQESIDVFRAYVRKALSGKGATRPLLFKGSLSSFILLLNVLKGTLGSYVYEYPTPRKLKGAKTIETIPNCMIMFINLRGVPKTTVNSLPFQAILKNDYFATNILNIHMYSPIFFADTNYIPGNSICLNLLNLIESVNIDSIVQSEGEKIIHWFFSCESFETVLSQPGITIKSACEKTRDQIVQDWIKEYCDIDETEISGMYASELYNKYCQTYNSNSKLTLKAFCIAASLFLTKTRRNKGIFYKGVKWRGQN